MTAKWTFMVYMAGDNNLSGAGYEDLDEMRKAGSTDAVNVLCQFDNAGSLGTRRFLVRKGGGDVVEKLDETDSGDPNVLLDYVKWAKACYPAERYALILWNHGGGWVPDALDAIATEVRAANYGRAEGIQRSHSKLGRTFFRPTVEKILSQPNPNDRMICSDDISGHSLDTIELGKVLEKVQEVLGQKLDLLGMDACLMSNLEVAYQAAPYVNYIVASEESEPNQGWPYEMVLPALLADPDMPTAAFASHIVQAYVQSYLDMGYHDDVTQTAFDLSQIGPFTTVLDEFAEAVRARLPRATTQVWKAHARTKRFWDQTLADIGSFSANIKKFSRTTTIRKAADGLAEALKPGDGKFVIAEAHNGPGVSACCGVTVYLPSPLEEVNRFYPALDYAQTQKWMPMIQAYVGG